MTVLRVIVLTTVGSVLGVTANALSPNGVTWEAVLPTAATDAESCVAPGAVQTVRLGEGLRLHQTGQATFIDVREAARYEQGHVEGALHLPCRSSAPLELKVALNRPLVVYGDGPDARWAADALRGRGFADVRLLGASFSDWRQVNGPAEAGSCEDCSDPP